MEKNLAELEKLIKNSNIKAAAESIGRLMTGPEDDKQRVMEMLALTPDKTALDLLDFLFEENVLAPGTAEPLFQLVIDRAHLHFPFVLILLRHGGRQRALAAVSLLRHVMGRETNTGILAEIIKTAGLNKLDKLTDDIAEFIFYDDPKLKSCAVQALERIGTERALDRLEKIAETSKCDQDVLDAVHLLKTNAQQGPLSITPEEPEPEPPAQAEPAGETPPDAAQPSFEDQLELLSSSDVAQRYQAFNYFSMRSEDVARALSECLDTDNEDLMISLLWLVTVSIPNDAIQDLFSIISNGPVDNRIKFCVYSALEAYPRLDSAAILTKGITEPAAYVRVAVVKALEKHCSDYVVAEIRQKIESGTKSGEELVRTILDVRAERLIQALLKSDTFSYIASNYLENKASPAALDTYIRILEDRNLKSTVKRFQKIRDDKAFGPKPLVMVVCPAQPYLEVYGRRIHTCGFEAVLHTGTQEAFEDLMNRKPSALICCVMLNNMSCIDFVKEARQVYGPDELPIIVSSLLKDFCVGKNQEKAKNAGITAVVEFPANPAQIKSWVKAG